MNSAKFSYAAGVFIIQGFTIMAFTLAWTHMPGSHTGLEYSGLLDPNYQKSGLSISTLCPCTRSQAMVRIFGQLYVKRSGHRFSAWDVHFKWLSKMPKKPMPCLRSARRVEQYWGTLSTVPRQYEGSEKARRVLRCPVQALFSVELAGTAQRCCLAWNGQIGDWCDSCFAK